jgi:5-methylcytosine-specific restriction endonuclease McrA
MPKRDPKFGKQKGIIRLGIIPLDEVLPKIKDFLPLWTQVDHNQLKATISGYSINMYSTRLACFAINGVKCSKCGLEGKFFAIEKYEHCINPHVNLYALDANNKEVLMTRDHIIPKGQGGKDILSNTQTMCTNCNWEKGNDLTVDAKEIQK